MIPLKVSTLFSLMFARQVDLNPRKGPKPKNKRTPVSVEELVKRAEHVADIIFPAIKERTDKIIAEYNKKFNGKHYLIDIPIGTPVMIKIPGGRPTALLLLYTGSYTVVCKTSAGTFVLKDESNELLHRGYEPSELKVVSMDESVIEE
jgi:hypothetical protein